MTLSRYNALEWIHKIVWCEEPVEDESWKQLELDITPTECRHEFYDDDNDRGMGIFCKKCDYFSEVSFISPYHDKTYQEIYEIMQKERRLK